MHSSFDTVSLDLYTNNLNVFRSSHKSTNNKTFPAICQDTEFVRAAQNNSCFEGFDCSLHKRILVSNSNCIASIAEYGRFFDAYTKHIHGIWFDINQYTGIKKQKSDSILLDRKKGTYGTTLAIAGANDMTSAGKMHAHLLCCACPQPHVITQTGKSECLCNTLVPVLPSHYQMGFDRSVHIYQLIHLFLQSLDQEHKHYVYPYFLQGSKLILPCIMDMPPSAAINPNKFYQFEQIHSSHTQWHLHSFRCHQRDHRKHGFCSDYP